MQRINAFAAVPDVFFKIKNFLDKNPRGNENSLHIWLNQETSGMLLNITKKLVWLNCALLAILLKPELQYNVGKQKVIERKEVLDMNSKLKKIVMAALFAAFACVATMSIRIPTPGTGGYIHPGDAIVILSGVILGPVWGLLAAGIGSAMADLLGGYFIYVPITFVIKGLIAFAAGVLYQKIGKTSKSSYAAVILGGVADILLVAGGYFLCEIFLYGTAAALASVPANVIQGIGGLVISAVLYPILLAIPDIRRAARLLE